MRKRSIAQFIFTFILSSILISGYSYAEDVGSDVVCASSISIRGAPGSGGIPACACDEVDTTGAFGTAGYCMIYDSNNNLVDGFDANSSYCSAADLQGICPPDLTCTPSGNSWYCVGEDEPACGPERACGSDGGCADGYRCTKPDHWIEEYLCVEDSTCTTPLEWDCTPNVCGLDAGCPYGERCIKENYVDEYYCSPDSTCGGISECTTTLAEYNSNSCGTGGCSPDERCVPGDGLGGAWGNHEFFVCEQQALCGDHLCGSFGLPCCSNAYCNSPSADHPNVTCDITSDASDVNYCIDDPRVGPRDGNIFKRRPGQPYSGYLLANFTGLMQGLFKILYPTAIIIGVAFLLKGAYGFMVSEGDPQKVKEAQTQLSSAIVGVLFVLLSAAILRIIISNILGVSTNL